MIDVRHPLALLSFLWSNEACSFPPINATAKLFSVIKQSSCMVLVPIAKTSGVFASVYGLQSLCQFNTWHILLEWPSLINTELQEFGWNGSYSFRGNQSSIYATLVTFSRSPFVVWLVIKRDRLQMPNDSRNLHLARRCIWSEAT